jgi:predicted TIM-barrel fold metal-dependent hydrolase
MSTVIDADAHVVEGAAFTAQVFERWPDKIEFRVSPTDGASLVIEGRRYPESEGPGAGCPPEHGITRAEGIDPYSPDGIVADSDREGIDRMVLFPSLGLATPGLADLDFAAGFARLYNDFIADYCESMAGRLLGVAVVPNEDVDTSIAVMTEAKKLGLVCTLVPPALKTRNLDHPDLDSFYAAAEDLDMPLGIHGAPGVHLPKIGVDRFTNYIQVHCVSFPFDQMAAMTALVSGGVFDRHPKLRVAFLESGVGWIPYFIDRLHEHYEKRGSWIEGGWQREPREYLERGQIWATCEPEEPILPGVVDVLGSGFIMYASDYPHWDGDFPESTKPLRTRTDITDATREKILGDNAARFFAID